MSEDKLQQLIHLYTDLMKTHLHNGFTNNYEIKIVIGYKEQPKGLWIKETSFKVIEQ